MTDASISEIPQATMEENIQNAREDEKNRSIDIIGSAIEPYKRAFEELNDGHFDLGDITSPAIVGLDVLGWVFDPFGSIAGAILGPVLDWLLANIPPLKWALDVLAGDQREIRHLIAEWMNVSREIAEAGNNHASTANDLPTWSQEGSEQYHDILRATNKAFQATAKQCASFAEGIKFIGQVCAGVRELIWGLVKDFLSSIVGNALAALATSLFTAGGSVAAFIAWAQGKLAWVVGKISSKLSKLASFLSKAASRWGDLSDKLAEAAEALSKMSHRNYGRSGGFSKSASKKTSGRLKVKEIDEPSFISRDKFSAKKRHRINDILSKSKSDIYSPIDKIDETGDAHPDTTAPTVDEIP